MHKMTKLAVESAGMDVRISFEPTGPHVFRAYIKQTVRYVVHLLRAFAGASWWLVHVEMLRARGFRRAILAYSGN